MSTNLGDASNSVNSIIQSLSSLNFSLSPTFDGRMHRFDRTKKRSGWYIGYMVKTDSGREWPVLVCGDWCTGEKHKLLCKANNETENQKIKAAIERAMEDEGRRRLEKIEFAVSYAAEEWNLAEPALKSEYITRKGFSHNFGCRVTKDGTLLVPTYAENIMFGLQKIFPDGTKRFVSGQRVKGCFYTIGHVASDRLSYLCEGFATGCSIHEATGAPVVVAFSANNMVDVAKTFAGHNMVVAADNDRFTEGNPGITAAQKASAYLGTKFLTPVFPTGDDKSTDFNDLHSVSGLEAVRKQLEVNVEAAKQSLNVIQGGAKVRLAGKILTNFDGEWVTNKKGELKLVKHPRPIQNIWEQLEFFLPKVFKRMGNTPFCVVGDEVFVLDKHSKLFAMIQKMGVVVEWTDYGDATVKRADFYNYLGQHAEKYDIVSELPTYPEMPGVFYTKKIAPQENGKLSKLVSMFNFATEVDSQLIKAMFMTPFWGGECGQRPAFLIDGLEDDTKGNRGIGKTTLTDALVELCGGSCVDLTSKTDGEDIRKRLLTAVTERVVRMDNIKAQTLSNETLESLITAKRVSGHQMFRGHNSIPNAFTYVLTFNDAVLSKDMSQRCIIIRLKRPHYRADWWENVSTFISEHREEIIADIGFLFSRSVGEVGISSRFPRWEKSVLAKCAADLEEVQKSIKRDQESVDDDAHLKDDFRDLIMEKIGGIYFSEGKNFNPEKHVVALNRSVIYKWAADLFPKGMSHRFIAKKLHNAFPKEFLADPIKYNGAWYLIWVGEHTSTPGFEPKSAYRVEMGESIKVKEWKF